MRAVAQLRLTAVGRLASSFAFAARQVHQQPGRLRGRAPLRGERHPEPAGCADGRRTAHGHVADGTGHALDIVIGQDLEDLGQGPLIDHLDLAVFPPDCPCHLWPPGLQPRPHAAAHDFPRQARAARSCLANKMPSKTEGKSTYRPPSHLSTSPTDARLPELAPTWTRDLMQMRSSAPSLAGELGSPVRAWAAQVKRLAIACNRSPGLQVVAGGSQGRSLPPSG